MMKSTTMLQKMQKLATRHVIKQMASQMQQMTPMGQMAVRTSTQLGVRGFATNGPGGDSTSLNFFQKERLPANTVIKFVPQQEAWIVERMGRFHRVLEPGLAILVPILDKIQYVQSLKESAIEVPSQSAITSDNVTLELDGVLYIKVMDPYKASYGVEDAEYAISQLAQTTMRSEIGQLTLDHCLRERQSLNNNITAVLNELAQDWGIKCLRYEIRDIHPPSNVLELMHRQVSAERSKRAEILDSEGQRQSLINIAEGQRESRILLSEAEKMEKINLALGELELILLKSKAEAQGLKIIAELINKTEGGNDLVSLKVAEQYVNLFAKLAKESNSVVIPAGLNDMSSWMASGMSIYNNLNKK